MKSSRQPSGAAAAGSTVSGGGGARTGTDKPGTGLKFSSGMNFKGSKPQCSEGHGDDDDDDGEEELGGGLGGAKKHVLINKTNATNLQKVEDLQPQRKVIKSQQDFHRELFKILKVYFNSAFTIIIKNRRLCPSDGFQTVRVLGTKVPKFLHPSSLEYVEEVSKKLILFLNRNITEGCVIHVMLEKNKTMYVVQRFVFKLFGNVDLGGQHEDALENVYNLEDVRNQCRESLLEILNCDEIQPMLSPQFSRWSISVGVKKEFVEINEEGFKQLWSQDPCAGYFPWKQRPKSLANCSRRVSCKLDFSSQGLNTPDDSKQTTTIEELPFCDIHVKNEPGTTSSSSTSTNDEPDNRTNDSAMDIDRTVYTPTSQNTPSNSSRSTPVVLTQKDFSGIICFPVSSFVIIPGLILSVYGLEYPAPESSATPTTPTSQPGSSSTRSFRSSSGHSHHHHRLSHSRNRLLRQPNWT